MPRATAANPTAMPAATTSTDSDRSSAGDRLIHALLGRATAGLLLMPHGAQKLFGWFGGAGLEASGQMFQTKLGLPPALALVAGLIEFFGGLLLALGLATRLVAFLIAAQMFYVVFAVHWQAGFFAQKGGFEYPGHTEYLQQLTDSPRAVMMLAGGGLRVVPLTIHIPLSQVPRRISEVAIVETGETDKKGNHYTAAGSIACTTNIDGKWYVCNSRGELAFGKTDYETESEAVEAAQKLNGKSTDPDDKAKQPVK